MWITTCHRFTSRAEFVAVCLAAGWTCPPGQDPEPPLGVALDILGPIVETAQIGEGGALIPGEVLDPRYHVNVAWHGRESEAAFQASLVMPASPSREWDVATPSASSPPVPSIIPAWKGKAWLHQTGLLNKALEAAEAAGPMARFAFGNAAEWDRASLLVATLASGLGLSDSEVDAAFLKATTINA